MISETHTFYIPDKQSVERLRIILERQIGLPVHMMRPLRLTFSWLPYTNVLPRAIISEWEIRWAIIPTYWQLLWLECLQRGQEEGRLSLEAQAKHLAQYCSYNGLVVLKTYKIAESASKLSNEKSSKQCSTLLRRTLRISSFRKSWSSCP